MPLVSVIIPNYNHEKYLRQRIASVLNQSFTDFELIILDDFSMDDSRDLIEQYRNDNKVSQIVYNEVNSGSVFKQWRKGIELAKGEWIWIAESDDFSDLSFVAKMLSLVDQYPDINLIFCNSRLIDTQDNELPESYLSAQYRGRIWEKDFVSKGLDFIKSTMIYFNGIPNASAVVFRKSAIKHNPVILQMKYCGDWIFWTDLLKSGDVGYVSESLNYYRQHNESTRVIKNVFEEKRRLTEVFMAIRNARKSISLDIFLFRGNKSYYNWIFDDIKAKSTKVGLVNRYVFSFKIPMGLFVSYGRMLCSVFYDRFKKKITNR